MIKKSQYDRELTYYLINSTNDEVASLLANALKWAFEAHIYEQKDVAKIVEDLNLIQQNDKTHIYINSQIKDSSALLNYSDWYEQQKIRFCFMINIINDVDPQNDPATNFDENQKYSSVIYKSRFYQYDKETKTHKLDYLQLKQYAWSLALSYFHNCILYKINRCIESNILKQDLNKIIQGDFDLVRMWAMNDKINEYVKLQKNNQKTKKRELEL